MENELIKPFIRKAVRKVIVFAFLMIIASSIGQAVSPVITNEIALGQMQNTNDAFVAIDTYNRIRPLIGVLYMSITTWFAYTLGRDTYKLVKAINSTKNKEN